jgi:hypothetical protein
MLAKFLKRSRAGFSLIEILYASAVSIIVVVVLMKVLVDFALNRKYFKAIEAQAVIAEKKLMLQQLTEAIAADDFIDKYEPFSYTLCSDALLTDGFVHVQRVDALTLNEHRDGEIFLDGRSEFIFVKRMPIARPDPDPINGREVIGLVFELPEPTNFMKGISKEIKEGSIYVRIMTLTRENNSLRPRYSTDALPPDAKDSILVIQWDYASRRQALTIIGKVHDSPSAPHFEYDVRIDGIRNMYLRPVFTGGYGNIPNLTAVDAQLKFPAGHTRGSSASISSWRKPYPLACTQRNFSILMALGKVGLVARVYLLFEYYPTL